MKKIFFIIVIFSLVSCNKMQEMKDEIYAKSKEVVERKTNEAINETIGKSLNEITKTEAVKFENIFQADSTKISNSNGRKINLPTGKNIYLLKFSGKKDYVLNQLLAQPTTDETKSDKNFHKIDGQTILSKLELIKNFVPKNSGVDLSILDEIRNDSSIEYYKICRFPNNSTLIFIPKNNTFLQFVEVK